MTRSPSNDNPEPIRSILLTGAGGLLGWRVADIAGDRYFLNRVYHSQPRRHRDPMPIVADLTTAAGVQRLAQYDFEPDVIINCAADADVDHCQTHENAARAINVIAVERLLKQFPAARFVQISTDYVFGNWPEKGTRPPGPTDRVRPINVYGRQKREAEKIVLNASPRHLIVRVNSLFDYRGRNNMFRYVYESLSRGEEVTAISDQISNPIFTIDTAELTMKLITNGAQGIYHLGGRDFVSRYTFACRVAGFYGLNKKRIVAVEADAFHRPAPRPHKAGLDCSAAEAFLNVRMPSLASAFTRIRKELPSHRA